MKQKFIFAILMLCLCFSCKHDEEKKNVVNQGGEDGDPSLSLAEMYVHFQKVENNSVTISWPEINAFDIVAKFNYGNVKLEEIPVVMASSQVMLMKDAEIPLSVPAVAGKYKGWKGKLTVKKIEAVKIDKDVIGDVLLNNGKNKGVDLLDSVALMNEMKKGNYPTIEVKGGYFDFTIMQQKNKWSNARLNGKDISVESSLLAKSSYREVRDISTLNSIVPILFEATFNGKKASVHFKIKHIEGTCDIPDLGLKVEDKKVTSAAFGDGKGLEKLSDGSWPVYDGKETSKCVITWHADEVAECVINERLQNIGTGKNEFGDDVYLVEYDATECTSEGKEITIILKPKRAKVFHEVKWEFKIKKV